MEDGENREQLDQSGLAEDEATSERTLVPLQVSQVDFYGDKLMVVLVETGGEHQVLVPLRQFCQYLGVDWASQYQRTKRDEILAREMMSVVITTTLIPVRGQRQSYPERCDDPCAHTGHDRASHDCPTIAAWESTGPTGPDRPRLGDCTFFTRQQKPLEAVR